MQLLVDTPQAALLQSALSVLSSLDSQQSVASACLDANPAAGAILKRWMNLTFDLIGNKNPTSTRVIGVHLLTSSINQMDNSTIRSYHARISTLLLAMFKETHSVATSIACSLSYLSLRALVTLLARSQLWADTKRDVVLQCAPRTVSAAVESVSSLFTVDLHGAATLPDDGFTSQQPSQRTEQLSRVTLSASVETCVS